ncbi:hypothetical protein COCCADRAFT_110003 [Bipolaris zeicola 26-R-13]|uniref:F-box domain-containing protein n=1 Tax=Cochliobolus carbonum (strain 26-R-13) TaxID=930089 RepID=W6XS16_COCC2|nr:uncharacterized protein COCCADRAFT_110003 [Bipolaris zeicola 26-R-13]EUC28105.1 hypothetical protein COCCADRAFT_110003 [Bipolaris zeicola 26-R-13]
MARSAKQKAARNLRRGSRPVFQFTKLPAELQLLVLCRCDLVSIGRLLSVSSYVRSLYIQYPEIVIQGSLSENPQPLAGLLHVATVLHNISDDDFDSDKPFELLEHANSNQWPVIYSRFLRSGDDVLDYMRSLVDIYVEVDVAADIVAQGMNAAMQIYIDPQVAVTPVVLSVAEHTRLVCALLIVKIHYQLRSKFEPDGPMSARDFATAFMQTLAPWQMAQSSSVEGFLDSCQKYPGGLFNEIIDKRYTCCECLLQRSSYLRNYSRDVAVDRYKGHAFAGDTSFPRYSPAAEVERRRIGRRESWAGRVGDAQHPATQLRNHGWMMYDTISPGDMMRRHLVWRVGMLFWDQSRLADWGMVDSSDVVTLGTQTAWRLGYMRRRYPYSLQRGHIEDTTSQQIVEWTRSHEQIDFEEFLARQLGQ